MWGKIRCDTHEKNFIRTIINAGTPTLGICLGAQLIAGVMGGEVFPYPEKEIGWFPVTAVQASNNDAFKFPQETIVFQWHGETFSLPTDATLLAELRGVKYIQQEGDILSAPKDLYQKVNSLMNDILVYLRQDS